MIGEEKLSKLDTLPLEKLPDIDLYIDQLTSFLDDKLSLYKRKDIDKAITKTMINNYTKAKLLPVSDKKKYSKKHLMLLILIYHLKSVLSMEDIKKITVSLTDSDTNLEEFYESFIKVQETGLESLKKEIGLKTDKLSQNKSTEEILLLCASLAYEAEIKKTMLEFLIDEYLSEDCGKKEK